MVVQEQKLRDVILTSLTDEIGRYLTHLYFRLIDFQARKPWVEESTDLKDSRAVFSISQQGPPVQPAEGVVEQVPLVAMGEILHPSKTIEGEVEQVL